MRVHMNRTVNEYLGNQLEFISEFNFSIVLEQNIWEHYIITGQL